ncbi:uncharacterized protein LOC119264271 isoform X5 [Pygocentrus nattereri]|uniref:uncharacterized protein LOC119264271 isoform X5 n=1 Tax=Pygocentrus nattereri TaxID=42514 RepID=UPI0018913094|nr:uncharacterized protein LOC119264271 isoform X5 [Pygocentrus nattereri]
MTLEESNMEQSKSSKKKRRNSGHSQLKIEENTVEVLTNSKSSQTETGNNLNQPTLMGPKPANTTLVHFTELGDPPLLWQPQHSTMTGIQQIIDCFSLRKFYCLSKQPEPDGYERSSRGCFPTSTSGGDVTCERNPQSCVPGPS